MKTQLNAAKIKHRWTQIIGVSVSCSFLFTLIGCAAFVRKFTRKRKKEDLPQEEMVLAPEEWKGPQMKIHPQTPFVR